jgi:hypothetical protein
MSWRHRKTGAGSFTASGPTDAEGAAVELEHAAKTLRGEGSHELITALLYLAEGPGPAPDWRKKDPYLTPPAPGDPDEPAAT